MAKGQHLSRYQQGIVKRYYEHKDTLRAQKLSELVSEIYLAAADEKKLARLWKTADAALTGSPADPKQVRAVIDARDLPGLTRLAADLAPGGRLAR
jgi:NADPH:quinone reductase-like Zn-dependent oxidoreductase